MSGEPIGIAPQETLSSANSTSNAIQFVITQMMSQMNTMIPVKVVKVSGSFCDVQPLVTQIDGAGNVEPHAVIHNVPFVRIQGGTNAIIIDPVAGDIGLALFASRDISAVKKNKAVSPPGSRRRYDLADGIYLGGVLNSAPTQYLEYTTDGINLVSPTKVTITAPMVEIDAAQSVTINSPIINTNGTFSSTASGSSTFGGTIQTTGDVIAGGISLENHVHGGVQTGGGTTSAPSAGGGSGATAPLGSESPSTAPAARMAVLADPSIFSVTGNDPDPTDEIELNLVPQIQYTVLMGQGTDSQPVFQAIPLAALPAGLATTSSVNTAISSALGSYAHTSDLAGYATTSALTLALGAYATSAALTSALAPYATASSLTAAIATIPGPGTATPAMDGTAAVGSATKYAREDHVHPTDTSRAPLASPTFTGTPAAPTATSDNSSTLLATTAFVIGQAGTATPLSDSANGATGTSVKYAREDHQHPVVPGFAIDMVTTSRSITTSESMLLIDTTSTNLTETLPPLSSAYNSVTKRGQIVTIKNIGTNGNSASLIGATVAGVVEKIEGVAAAIILSSPMSSVTVRAYATGWFITARV